MDMDKAVKAPTQVRVSPEAGISLRFLADTLGRPITDIVGEAVEQFRRKVLIEQSNQAYAALTDREDELEEMRAWEATLMDGLEEDEPH